MAIAHNMVRPEALYTTRIGRLDKKNPLTLILQFILLLVEDLQVVSRLLEMRIKKPLGERVEEETLGE